MTPSTAATVPRQLSVDSFFTLLDACRSPQKIRALRNRTHQQHPYHEKDADEVAAFIHPNTAMRRKRDSIALRRGQNDASKQILCLVVDFNTCSP
jgi:hypothetical protein